MTDHLPTELPARLADVGRVKLSRGRIGQC
jgi:hypothetical protein